jgi:hypothetical protein
MPHPTDVFVRPAPGLRIADPQTGDYLPESGALVPRSGFWLRRLKDGDVVAVASSLQSVLDAPISGTALIETASPPAPARGKKKE